MSLKSLLFFKSFLLLAVAAIPFNTFAAEQGNKPYLVKKGDCLWKIAANKSIFGNPWKWPLLYRANPELIRDPNLIEIGWKLKVPLSVSAAEAEDAIAFAKAFPGPGEGKVASKPAEQPLPAKQPRAPSEEKASENPAVQPKAEAKAQPEGSMAEPGQAEAPIVPVSSARTFWVVVFLAFVAALGLVIWRKVSKNRAMRVSAEPEPARPIYAVAAPSSAPAPVAPAPVSSPSAEPKAPSPTAMAAPSAPAPVAASEPEPPAVPPAEPVLEVKSEPAQAPETQTFSTTTTLGPQPSVPPAATSASQSPVQKAENREETSPTQNPPAPTQS